MSVLEIRDRKREIRKEVREKVRFDIHVSTNCHADKA